jgi:hypothetical protein
MARKFFDAFGITKPSTKDEIYNIIVPKYKTDTAIDSGIHFKKFFSYYKECPSSQLSDYLDLLKNINCLRFKLAKKTFIFMGNAETMYFPSPEMKIYFAFNDQARFLDIDFYHHLVKESDYKLLEEFLIKLGVSKYPRIIEKYVSSYEIKFKYDARYLYDKSVDGCENLLNNINKDRSIALWNILLSMIKETGNVKFLMGQHKAGNWESFESTELKRLKRKLWIVDINGKFVSPGEITIDELSDEYDKISNNAEILINTLGFKMSISDYLTDKEKKWIDIGKIFEGCSYEEIQDALEHIKQSESKKSKPVFPHRKISDLEQVQNGMADQYERAATKTYEQQMINVRTSQGNIDPETWLKETYKEEEKLICQICKEEMPFKKPDGNYYFEKREISINTRTDDSSFSKEINEQYLALCPVCAAKYTVFIQKNPEKMAGLCEKIRTGPTPSNDENTDIPVLLDNEQTITFVAPHLVRLQTILRKENNG